MSHASTSTPRGAVAAGDQQTAEAGATLLRAGGNAMDAACAAAFASFVVESPLSSPAGGGVALYGNADSGFEALDFFSAVPGLGGSPAELDFHALTVDFGPTSQEFHVGRGAASVPTAAFGLLKLHKQAGRAPLAEVLAPAMTLARHGFVHNAQVVWILRLLEGIVRLTPRVEALYCTDGAIIGPDVPLTNPAMADFIGAVGADGLAMLRGPFTDACLAGFGPERGGLLSRADLNAFQPRHLAPLRVPFAGREVLLQPPPSSGGTLIALAMRLTEALELGHTDFLGAEHLGAVARVLGATSAARGDGFDERIRQPGAAEALLADEAIERWRSTLGAGERALGSTTHISVVDDAGGAASITLSNGEGCGHLVGDFGFQMNNFLGEEDINPKGFHREAPGTAMTTMMAPTIALKEGRPELVLGSGGSNRIRSVVFQALVNALAFERPLAEAITAIRLHVEGRQLWFEDVDLAPSASAALRQAWPGSTSFSDTNMYFGGVHAVAIDQRRPVAVADARRGGGGALG